jgi:hypothetical protein
MIFLPKLYQTPAPLNIIDRDESHQPAEIGTLSASLTALPRERDSD